jgi:hypothetical protein
MTSENARIEALEKKLAANSREIERLQAVEAIRRLHFTYGYLMDKWLFDDIVDLYSETATLYFMNGVFKGREGARRLYGFSNGLRGPQEGFLSEHILAQEVIHVSEDATRAWGRFRCFLQIGVHESRRAEFPAHFAGQFWEAGVHENEYARENGEWKIKVFNYRITFQCNYEGGWARAPMTPLIVTNYDQTYPAAPLGPDELREQQPQWPHGFIMPFHYSHPVTGRPIGLGTVKG